MYSTVSKNVKLSFLFVVAVATFTFTSPTFANRYSRAYLTHCTHAPDAPPSAEFPFRDRHLKVNGYDIHYVEEGIGEPVLFVHGNPTWSYAWRNILPCVAKNANRRAIAIDLLGFGRSDKPDIAYTAQLHEEILSGFIKELGLKNLVLVGQDWGGPLMTYFAVHNPDVVEGLIFIESFAWHQEYSDSEEFAHIIRYLRSEEGQNVLINHPTWFADMFIRGGMINQNNLSEDIFNRYLEPFSSPDTRRAMAEFPKLLSIIGDQDTPVASTEFFNEIEERLPVLREKHIAILRMDPGNLISEQSWDKVESFMDVLPQTDVRFVGTGFHMAQEDNPVRISNSITGWLWEKGLARRQPWWWFAYR